jgi:hypothetical protein
MKKSILFSAFGVVSIILFSFSSRSFLRKSSTIDFEITNGTGENIDSLAIFSHGSNDMHLVVLEGGALNPNEIETYTIDGVDGDYDIVFHETNGLYCKNEFTVDESDPKTFKANEGSPTNFKADEGDLTNFIADESVLTNTTYSQQPLVRKGMLKPPKVTGGGKITMLSYGSGK